MPMKFNYQEIHKLVDRSDNMTWDNYTLLINIPRPNAFLKTNGVFINGKWHEQTRIGVNRSGQWNIPKKHIR